jgi:hypothetical protein
MAVSIGTDSSRDQSGVETTGVVAVGGVLRELSDIGRLDAPHRAASSGAADRRAGSGGASRVRFQVLFGPASVHPQRMGWPALVVSVTETGDSESDRAPGPSDRPALADPDWYGWRLIGANNRELGRSATSFVTYQLARHAVTSLREGVERLIALTVADRATGRWRWHVDLDGTTVAVGCRWYERGHDSRLGMDTFVRLARDADLVDGVLTLRDRHAPVQPRWASEVAP